MTSLPALIRPLYPPKKVNVYVRVCAREWAETMAGGRAGRDRRSMAVRPRDLHRTVPRRAFPRIPML